MRTSWLFLLSLAACGPVDDGFGAWCDDGACTVVEAPLDPDDPDGDHIELAVRTVPANGTPMGTLFVNFGGFGAPGVDRIDAFADAQPELHASYDIVSWDPRGVNRSTNVNDCVLGWEDVRATAGPVRNRDDAVAQIEARRVLLDDCAERHGPIVDHMGYTAHASDLEAVRDAVGAETLHYFGYSAGTALGQVYADTYPDRVGRMVIDSATPAFGGSRDLIGWQVPGLAAAIDDFAAWCVRQGEAGCRVEDPSGAPQRIAERAAAGLLSTEPDLVMLGMVSALYTPRRYPALAEALAFADDGHPIELMNLAGGAADEGANLVYYLTQCAEEQEPTTVDDVVRLHAEYTEVTALAPIYAVDHAWCAAYGTPGNALDHVPTAPDVAEDILILQSSVDLATPLAAGEQVAANLEHARLVVYEGAGHSASGHSVCMNDHAVRLLVDGILPEDGARCPAQ